MGYSECLRPNRSSPGFAFLKDRKRDIRIFFIQSLQLFNCLFILIEYRACYVYKGLLFHDIEFNSKHIRLRLIVRGLSNGQLLFFRKRSLDQIRFNSKCVCVQWMKPSESKRAISGDHSLLYQIIWFCNHISRLYWNTIKVGYWSICAKRSPVTN